MTEIVCISHAPWQTVPTRTQHLMSRMRDAKVLFFAPPADPDARLSGGKRVRPGVLAYDLPPVRTIHPMLAVLTRRDLRRQAELIQGAAERQGFRNPLLWTTSPVDAALLDYLTYRGVAYDCHRYWTGLTPRLESDLAMAADVIFAASAGLVDRLAPCNENIALLPNGANYPMFSRTDLDLPPCLAELKGPILGFVGTIRADLDLAPIAACARAHPDWNLLLVGRVERGARLGALEECPNVRLLGQRPLVDIPEYVVRFRVCLDLRRDGPAGDDVMPGRVYEYLSAGQPVVRMHFPGQIAEHPGAIYAAHTADEFVRQCEHALAEDDPLLRQRRRDIAAAAAWSARADKAIEILETNGLYG